MSFICILLHISIARAVDWRSVSDSRLIDADSVDFIDNGNMVYWIKSVKSPSSFKNVFPKKKYKDYSHDLVYFEADCENSRARVAGGYSYNKNGDIIYTSNGVVDFFSIIPNSVHETEFYLVCDIIKPRIQAALNKPQINTVAPEIPDNLDCTMYSAVDAGDHLEGSCKGTPPTAEEKYRYELERRQQDLIAEQQRQNIKAAQETEERRRLLSKVNCTGVPGECGPGRVCLLFYGICKTNEEVNNIRKNAKNKEENEYKYKSLLGNKYKYDLSNPYDKMRYDIDLGAQLKDGISPMRNLDKGMGQYGGGIK
jgi:hypothetical protein